MSERLTENDHTTSDVQTHVETQFLRDGEWMPYVLIRRDEIGAVKCRHRTVVVTTTTHASDWQRGRKAETIPGPQSFPVHIGRKGDPIFTECDIDRANARRWSWDPDDATCKKCLAVVVPPAGCDTCDDTGRVPWIVEGDPHLYQERDADGTIQCPDCGVTSPSGASS